MHVINDEIKSCEKCQSLKKSTGGKEICSKHDGMLLDFEKELCEFCQPDLSCGPHRKAAELLDQESDRQEPTEESEKNENEEEMEPPSKKGKKRKAADNKNK